MHLGDGTLPPCGREIISRPHPRVLYIQSVASDKALRSLIESVTSIGSLRRWETRARTEPGKKNGVCDVPYVCHIHVCRAVRSKSSSCCHVWLTTI
jgi:hypothetical protein